MLLFAGASKSLKSACPKTFGISELNSDSPFAETLFPTFDVSSDDFFLNKPQPLRFANRANLSDPLLASCELGSVDVEGDPDLEDPVEYDSSS